eukprot:CAMPEP_0176377308 /NCGR_PEP_ID=MMETSP0126-20121128/28797_1 /TAXON_ID=141414 ORGANISM="Strombidinopsis acuminatum, Strain SPMC142" /NCGR_SAMPLE_ID=MMETSP0126 /ASSEMBLY_ACC=CAM_ASM_000229 /LENGTH=71 /DNA_ID=CAMNT_0017739093 /DNA_START=260 /DNA_END=475 /DNA_ORIENTATION=-
MKEFLAKYDLLEEDIVSKYNSKAAVYYRKFNQAAANNIPFFEAEPSYEEGRKDSREASSSNETKSQEATNN